MAELLVRVGGDDAALLRRLIVGQRGAPTARPSRVVVDAHVAARNPDIPELARTAGLPCLVDPQTYYLQDRQHDQDPWARLPFGSASVKTPADFASRSTVEALVSACVEYQLEHGASTVIPPYVHIDQKNDGWFQVQDLLWQSTARYIAAEGIRVPLLPILSIGWRLARRPAWPTALNPLLTRAQELGASEIGLALSRIDAGVKPQDRIASFTSAVAHSSARFGVIAWQQGVLGEAAVAAGAAGYETGLGRRERCDIKSAMSNRRSMSDSFGPRPVFAAPLMRSIPKRTIEALLRDPRFSPHLSCVEYSCCPAGVQSLLSDARMHAFTQRSRALDVLGQTETSSWRWKLLAERAQLGLELADRINAAASTIEGKVTRINTCALQGLLVFASAAATRRRNSRAA